MVIICQNEQKQGNPLSPEMPCLVPLPHIFPLSSGAPLEHSMALTTMVYASIFTPNQSDRSKPTLDPGTFLPSG